MHGRRVSIKVVRGKARKRTPFAVLLVLATMLGACSLFDKDAVAPDEPADKLYNEGLYLLNQKKEPKEAAKKFRGG